MSEPRITLQHILEVVRARPTTPDAELAIVEFLELPDAEQKTLIFRELINIGAQLNWIGEQLRR